MSDERDDGLLPPEPEENPTDAIEALNLQDALKRGIVYFNKYKYTFMLRTWKDGKTSISRLTKQNRWEFQNLASAAQIRQIGNAYIDAQKKKDQEALDALVIPESRE